MSAHTVPSQRAGYMATTDKTPEEQASPVRISLIAGRYLIFDPDAVARLRRQENVNGTLIGTTPQQPTQNIFLGLPVELRPEEANTLVFNKSAYIVNNVAAHKTVLDPSNTDSRRVYKESLRRSKQSAQSALDDRSASKAASVAARHGMDRSDVMVDLRSGRGIGSCAVASDANPSHSEVPNSHVNPLGLTPASSNRLLPQAVLPHDLDCTMGGALCQFLQRKGYYMTPGLRFGAQYSVYPGDPLRFHAHFMANEYSWDGEIPVLDLVCGGRLATAVKKAFLIGGVQLTHVSPIPSICTYSIEWAAM